MQGGEVIKGSVLPIKHHYLQLKSTAISYWKLHKLEEVGVGKVEKRDEIREGEEDGEEGRERRMGRVGRGGWRGG